MSVTLTCPHCGTYGPPATFLAEADGKRLAAKLADMDPRLARATLEYLRLFAPRARALQLARAVRLVEQLAALAAAPTVSRDERTGDTRPCTPALWALGIDQMLHSPPTTLPLSKHNYLRAIVYDLAGNPRAQAAAQAAAAPRTARVGNSPPVGRDPTSELAWARQMRDLGRMTDDELAKVEAKFSGKPVNPVTATATAEEPNA